MLSSEFKLSTLRAHDLFAPLTDLELEVMRPALSVRTASVGDVIMESGAPGDELCVLLVGEVKVVKDFRLPTEAVAATLAPMAVFGEMALLTGDPRSATVIATEPSRYLSVRREGLETVLLTYPSVCLTLLRDAYRKISELNARLRV